MRNLVHLLLVVFVGVNFTCKRNNRDTVSELITTDSALNMLGDRKAEFSKLLVHYRRHPEDSLKLKAAEFLIRSLPFQMYFEMACEPRLDSLFRAVQSVELSADKRAKVILFLDSTKLDTRLTIKRDADLIDASFLIENIDYAFKAWAQPYSRHISFQQFCEYLLPYKNESDKPVRWRKELFEKYSWLPDSLENRHSLVEACTKLNNALKPKFSLMTNMSKVPVIIPYNLMRINGFGLCRDITSYTTYSMRAIGIPVTWDFCMWSSRSLGHDWNTLMLPSKSAGGSSQFIPFLGADIDPFDYKIENEIVEYNRRAKVFRRMYSRQRSVVSKTPNSKSRLFRSILDENPLIMDVSSDFLKVSDFSLSIDQGIEGEIGCLSTYDEKIRGFRSCDCANAVNGKFNFKNIGRNNCYLPLVKTEAGHDTVMTPFILERSGSITVLKADTLHRTSLTLSRKHPYYNSNKIKINERYELNYYEGGWRSLGIQKALSNVLVYNNVPSNALLLLRNLDRGIEERPFTFHGDKQVWW